MDGGITITLPSIIAASITPNPISTGATILLSITVREISKTLYPQEIYPGEFYAGEI